MRFSWAKTPTMDEISRVNRGLMCPAVTTGCVLGGSLWWRPLCATTGPLCVWANAGQGGACGRHAPRAARVLRAPGRGWGVGRAVAGRMWPHAMSGRDTRGPPVWPRCRRRGISRRNSSEAKSRIPKPAARRRAKYPRRPRRVASDNRAARGRGVPSGRAGRAPLPMSGSLCARANVGARADATRRGRRGYFARRAVVGPTSGSLCTRANPRRGPCGRPAPRVVRIHRTPGERSCTGVIETRNRSAWATLRFGANKFNHLSICAREGPLTGFLSFFYFFEARGR